MKDFYCVIEFLLLWVSNEAELKMTEVFPKTLEIQQYIEI